MLPRADPGPGVLLGPGSTPAARGHRACLKTGAYAMKKLSIWCIILTYAGQADRGYWSQPTAAGVRPGPVRPRRPGGQCAPVYQVSWEPTVLDDGVVVRTYGRKGGWKRIALTPCASLEEAWPLIRAIIRTRLRHKYALAAIDQCAFSVEKNLRGQMS